METVYERLVSLGKCEYLNLKGVSVIPGETGDSAIITGGNKLGELANDLNQAGFTVDEHSNQAGHIYKVHVTLLRAETKLTRQFTAFSPNDYPDYEGNIIAAGPLVRTPGDIPRRIVLRKDVLNAKYVVHQQVIPDGMGVSCRPSFCYGSYFNNEADRPTAFERFTQRMMELEKMAFYALYKEAESEV